MSDSRIDCIYKSKNPFLETNYVIVEDFKRTAGNQGWVKYHHVNKKKIDNPLDKNQYEDEFSICAVSLNVFEDQYAFFSHNLQKAENILASNPKLHSKTTNAIENLDVNE